jgi:hypothetical protein
VQFRIISNNEFGLIFFLMFPGFLTRSQIKGYNGFKVLTEPLWIFNP